MIRLLATIVLLACTAAWSRQPVPTIQPGQAVVVAAPGPVIRLVSGQSYGRITIRPSVPTTIEAIGDGPRPIITDPVQLVDTYGGAGVLTFRGLHFDGKDRDRNLGVVIMDGVNRVVFEDCVFENCKIGLSIDRTGSVGASRVQLLGCVFYNNGAVGAFINGATGVLIDRCVFDYNGWGNSDLTGRPPTQSHGLYIIGCTNVVTKDTLFARSRMNGMRGCGQVVDRCLFLDNGCAIAAGADAMSITNNTVLYSHDPDPASGSLWGVGVDLNGGMGTVISGNLIAHARSLGNVGAFSLHGEWTLVRLVGNTVVGWDVAAGNGAAYSWHGGYGPSMRMNAVTCQPRGVVDHGEKPDGLIDQWGRVLRPDELVDPEADPVKWCAEVLGEPGCSPYQAVQRIVAECVKDRAVIAQCAAWHRQRLKSK